MDILRSFWTRATPQSEQAEPRQVENAAGGYTFVPSEQSQLHRFLTLGTDGGTYYTNAKDLTKDNAAVVLRAAHTDAIGLVRQIVEVSEAGRAPRQNPALFALAIAASVSDDDGRAAALAALPRVARTGTHLFLFACYVDQFRGWGRGLRRAVGNWYAEKPSDQLAYQVCKYRQREGWTHRDLLRLAHPANDSEAKAALYEWICGREHGDGAALPALVHAFISAQAATAVDEWVAVINANPALSWEMLPDAALTEADVWRALISHGMPHTALMRQLPRLTRLGVLDGDVGRAVATQLQDTDRLIKARVHPVNVLVAQRTYTSGRSARGESAWTPNARISDALDAAFYNAYGAVEPANKRTLLALDVSASMTTSASGLPVSCREASAALAMVTAATESHCRVVGFTSSSGGYDWRANTALTELDISPRRRLDDVCRYVGELPMGGTDCALPMVWARKNRVEVDTFHIYTDNETWHGAIHPHQALREYREKMGIDARLVVVAMTAGGATIADPSDPRQLDVSGFDSSVPNLLSDFSRGDI
jgi:60 kDa SS-A/Ro ribonucleoprotein